MARRPGKILALLGFPLVALSLEPHHRVWPAAQVEVYSSEHSPVLHTLSLPGFAFRYSGYYESVLEYLGAAKARWTRALERSPSHANTHPANTDQRTLRSVLGVDIKIETNNSRLDIDTDESYAFAVPTGKRKDKYVKVEAKTVFGVLRALQSLLQLIRFAWMDEETSQPVYVLVQAPFRLLDTPTYHFRGLMIDTSRHFLPLDLITRNLDAMEAAKLNVLHWHLTDSQSWPWSSQNFPELTKGAYCPECIYTRQDIERVIQEANLRGIRVVLEVDLPGHTQGKSVACSDRFFSDPHRLRPFTFFAPAIGDSHPEFLTSCGKHGLSEPLDVTNQDLYPFVYSLYSELANITIDRALHTGGDEVSLDCWKKSPKIRAWMSRHNMTEEVELVRYFEKKLLQYVTTHLHKIPIVWQELVDSGVELPPGTMVDVWKEGDTSAREKATRAGYPVLFSACWYLDHLGENWSSMYSCDPRAFNGTQEQKNLVLGGHASMWGERVDASNFLERVWPRAAAVAEALWTGDVEASRAKDSALERLEAFRCDLVVRHGIPASPIAPGAPCDVLEETRSALQLSASRRGETAATQ